jgi:hypothetical protein
MRQARLNDSQHADHFAVDVVHPFRVGPSDLAIGPPNRAAALFTRMWIFPNRDDAEPTAAFTASMLFMSVGIAMTPALLLHWISRAA